MSSGEKIKEHMESELSGIFQLKLVAKNGIWFLRDLFYIFGGQSNIHFNETL